MGVYLRRPAGHKLHEDAEGVDIGGFIDQDKQQEAAQINQQIAAATRTYTTQLNTYNGQSIQLQKKMEGASADEIVKYKQQLAQVENRKLDLEKSYNAKLYTLKKNLAELLKNSGKNTDSQNTNNQQQQQQQQNAGQQNANGENGNQNQNQNESRKSARNRRRLFEGANRKQEILVSVIREVMNDITLSYELSDDEVRKLARKVNDLFNQNKDSENIVEDTRVGIKSYLLKHSSISLSQSEINQFNDALFDTLENEYSDTFDFVFGLDDIVDETEDPDYNFHDFFYDDGKIRPLKKGRRY